MPLEYHFTCPLPNGLHARPATQLARVAGRFAARIELTNERTGERANAASVLDLVSAGVLLGDRCRLSFAGPDETAARSGVAEFIDRELEHCDAPLSGAPQSGNRRLPRGLAASGAAWVSGEPLSAGCAIGELVFAAAAGQPEALPGRPAMHPAQESQRAAEAITALAAEFEALALAAALPEAREILEASRAILLDPELRATLEQRIAAGEPAELAALEASAVFSVQLQASDSAYLRERHHDVTDIGQRLFARLSGQEDGPPPPPLSAPSILCAPSLSPAQLLALDQRWLAGVVLGGPLGAGAHSAILARALDIPLLSGVGDISALAAGSRAVLDASAGVLIAPITPELERYYTRELVARSRRAQRLESAAASPARTADGRRIEVAANISAAAEAANAAAQGAEGVGLFRTEMLYSAGDRPPTEHEQYTAYRSALAALGGQPLVIRAFDVGGDKPLPYLRLPAETNPFLGYRGMRMYAAHPELIDAQLRAVCRASAHGPIRLMAPMVATADEARLFHHRVINTQLGLRAGGIEFDERMPVGVMLEVPAAALAVGALSAVCDFFSIGSNDLSQYFFAADRGNPKVADLNNERHPAFLRLLKLACDEARLQGRWIGLCGEMARDPRNAPLLAGLGLDELSMAAPGIPAVKAALGELDSRECRALLERACVCTSVAEVEALLDIFHARAAAQPLLADELLVFDSDCADKAEALRTLALLLYSAGRTDNPDALEDALWAREGEFSTGLGHGMAIPHCKTAAVNAGTLAVLRLRRPVDWEALDGAPVDTVIMLTMREAADNQHLRVFAQLARRLMDEGFRDALRGAADQAALLELLRRELEVE